MFETFIRHFLFSFSLKSMSEKVCQSKRGWQQGVPRGNISGHQDLHWRPRQEDCHIPHLIWGGGHHFWWWRWISGCNKTLHDYNQETSYSNNQWWVKLAQLGSEQKVTVCDMWISYHGTCFVQIQSLVLHLMDTLRKSISNLLQW